MQRIQIRSVATTTREYDAIVVDAGGLLLSCDLINGWAGDRQIRLAKMLADQCGIELEPQDQRLVTRLQGALAYSTEKP